jgi:hypothetical protein
MKRSLCLPAFCALFLGVAPAQIAKVKRNTFLRESASSTSTPITTLSPAVTLVGSRTQNGL